MGSPINLSEVTYLLQHTSDLRKITQVQALTLALSSVGAAVTAYAMVTPVDWQLVAMAFVGSLVANAIHLLQAPPGKETMVKVESASSVVVDPNSVDDVFGVKK